MAAKARLTTEQGRFVAMLEHAAWLSAYWDFDAQSCDLERLRADISAWSHGEQILARFLVGVWCGDNVLGCDLIDAASVLDPEHRALIARWLERPVWP